MAKPLSPKVQAMLDKLRAARAEGNLNPLHQESKDKKESLLVTDRYGNAIRLNEKQEEFIKIAVTGKDCVLTGAAGTGKTTCQKTVAAELISSGKAGTLSSFGHKYLPNNTPGIVIVSFTRRAVNNIRNNMPLELKNNCLTIHKLLEYEPVTASVMGKTEVKSKSYFQPTRNKYNPLDTSVRVVIVEEGSTVSVDFFAELEEALPHKPQYIFLGDIQQLPPVFGDSILGHKMAELPYVELTEIYRQALDNPIISLAHRILSGKALPQAEAEQISMDGKLHFHFWKKDNVMPEQAVGIAGRFYCGLIDSEKLDPEEDIILCPYNKAFGTIELNKYIANHLARKREAETFEIVAGFTKEYFSIGDKVLYDKSEATITDIYPNKSYTGKQPQLSATNLDYWGNYIVEGQKDHEFSFTETDDDFDAFLDKISVGEEERVNQASHCIKLSMRDAEKEITINDVGSVRQLSLAYAITVHKSQGSEWRNVFLCFHSSHAKMISRELLYTAATRAREFLHVLCSPKTFVKGIETQRIKGETLQDKIEFFKGRK